MVQKHVRTSHSVQGATSWTTHCRSPQKIQLQAPGTTETLAVHILQVRVGEAKLKKQVQALTENGHANHSAPEASHEELLEARKRQEAAEAQLGRLREVARDQQVQVASLQRQVEKLQQDCATAQVAS